MHSSLRFENIEKIYGERVLLSIDELEVRYGEFSLISGKNGSGKTTLLKIISGLLRPEHAVVTSNQVPLPWKKAKSILRKHVVYLHQTPYMFDTTVFNNVAYGLKLSGVPRNQIEDRVWQTLRWGKLDHLTHRNARLLSGGEMQRVALIRARIINPAFLVLDEPTTNMDRSSRQQTHELVQQLQSEGMSIVMATHDIESFADIVNHHYYLEAGHIGKIDIGARARKNKTKGVVTPFRKDQN